MAVPNTPDVAFEAPYYPPLFDSSPDTQPRHSAVPPPSSNSVLNSARGVVSTFSPPSSDSELSPALGVISTFPAFHSTQICYQIHTDDGRRIQPEIDCEINKGTFFSSDGIWTTYRRNVFAVDCSYILQPEVGSHQLFLTYGDDEAASPVRERIQAIAISLSAEAADGDGRAIELIQQTPKRDKGPQETIGFVLLWPTSLQPEKNAVRPSLPLQEIQRPGSAGVDIRHSFERIQFKSATAYNGRAQQQYYHVKVDLYCDIRSNADHAPRWIKAAHRNSVALVVRGRSTNLRTSEYLSNSSVGSSGPGSWKVEAVGRPAVPPTQKNHQTLPQVPLFGNTNWGPILEPDSANRGNHPEPLSPLPQGEPEAEVSTACISTQDMLDAFGNHEELLRIAIERGKAFLHNRIALKGFREGILDSPVGLENARQNRRIFGMDTKEAHGTEYHVFKTDPFLSNFQTTWHRALRNLRKAIRPGPKTGTRRIEWECECGEELFADFNNEDRTALDALEAALHQSAVFADTTIDTSNSGPQAGSSTEGGETAALSTSSPQQQSCYATTTGDDPASATGTQSDVAAAQQASCSPRHLAICISTGGIYKCLSEIDVSKMKSDSQLFLTIADIYRSSSTSLSPWKKLLKPVGVEFILLSVWDTRGGYISIFDRPRCVPPEDDADYDFNPRPLKPLPPVPPEIFVHYIQKHTKPGRDIFLRTPVWTPRLPTRKGKRLIDCDVGTYGWGIYIREGPNRLFVFWMVILSVVCSVLLSLLWVGLKGDVQGASGLGTLILGVHSVVMAAFMFKFGEVQ